MHLHVPYEPYLRVAFSDHKMGKQSTNLKLLTGMHLKISFCFVIQKGRMLKVDLINVHESNERITISYSF